MVECTFVEDEAEYVFQTDNGTGSDSSLPESWSSLNDDKYIDSVRELVNHHVSSSKRCSDLSCKRRSSSLLKRLISDVEERASCPGERTAE